MTDLIMSSEISDVIQHFIYFLCIIFSFVGICVIGIYITNWTMAEIKNTDVIPQVVTSEDIFNALSVMSTEITALSKIVRNKLKVKDLPQKKVAPKKPQPSKPPCKDAKRKPKTARNE